MRKTSKKAMAILEKFNNNLEYFEEVLRVKKLPLENQNNFIKDHSIEWFEGWISGIKSATEDFLFIDHCYHGFHYVDSLGNWLTADDGKYITDHQEYRDFRVKYFTK